MSYIASWSGGKDSCFALYKAMQMGYQVSHLVNFVVKRLNRVSFHGTDVRLIQLQSQAIGISLVQKDTTWNGYEQEFKEAIRYLIPSGIEGVIFGDVYIQEHKDWVERVCHELNIHAMEPLWGESTGEIVSEFINREFKAVIVAAKSELIDKYWIGKIVDKAFMEYLTMKDIDLCGENGEYHTLVLDVPIFHHQIEITDSRAINRDGYWFLDSIKYDLSG